MIALAATTLMVGGAATLGCGTQCDRHPDEPPQPYKEGRTNAAEGTYFTSSEKGPFLDFPPGRTYRLFHGLHGVPQAFEAWLAFSPRPDPGGGFVEAAGNQVTFEAVTAEYVDVRNDTCSEVWIRVGVNSPILASQPDAGDGGP
jgi:hypothetical protein